MDLERGHGWLRDAEITTRIGRYFEALKTEERKAPERTNCPARALIYNLGLGSLIEAPSGEGAPGAFIFSRPADRWRAELFLELILRPVARAYPAAPAYTDTVLGWRHSDTACRRLSLAPAPFLRKIDADDLLELRRALPGFREPVKVIDVFLEELADAKVLRRRPRRATDAWLRDVYDPHLRNVKGGSYSVAPGFLECQSASNSNPLLECAPLDGIVSRVVV